MGDNDIKTQIDNWKLPLIDYMGDPFYIDLLAMVKRNRFDYAYF